jgi:hypothetical protein
MSFLSTMLNASVVGSAMSTLGDTPSTEPVAEADPNLIDLSEATVDWLSDFLMLLRVGGTTVPRTVPEAQKWFLGERLGLSVSDLSVSDRGLRFEIDELYRDSIEKLLAVTILHQGVRLRFSGLDGVMNQQPYSEPSPYIEVSFNA